MGAVSEFRTKLSLAGAVILLLVVAAAAGVAGGPGAARSSSASGGGLGVPDWAGSLIVGFVAAAGIVLAYGVLVGLLRGLRGRRRFVTKKLPWWAWLVMFLSTAAAVALLLGLLKLVAHGKPHPAAPVQSGALGRLLPSFPHASSQAAPSVSWQPFVLGAAVALLAVAGYWLFARRKARPTPFPKPHDKPEAVQQRRREAVAAIDESLDALWAEADPRKAVIAAYARMDSWLARAGFGRKAYEAPFEHLDRVMGGLGATAAVGAALAELFERAKFDRRPCGPEMKRSALGALVQLRDELSAASLLPAVGQ